VNDLLGLPFTRLAGPLVLATLAAVAALALQAVRRPYLARIGLRNVPRRRLLTGLIVFGLMLATMFVAAAFAVDDTITLAVRTVAVFNLGRVDEEVVGGTGPLGVYSAETGADVSRALAHDDHVAGVSPALVVPNLLLADETARQVRGGVSGLGLAGDKAGPLGNIRTLGGAPAPVSALGPSDVYLNRNTGALLDARAGDTVNLYSDLWLGQRYRFRVRAVVSGGPLGDSPAIVMPLATLQTLTGYPNGINRIYVANRGDGLTGVQYSADVANQIDFVIPPELHVITAKLDGVQFALQAQDVFGRILALFTLFALSIGLLLIFLIFVLLAAERRAELGMARAMGMRRSHIVGMLLIEGVAYDGFSTALGMLVGLGLGVAIVGGVGPTIARLGFPLRVAMSPESVVVALCLGFLFTLGTIALAATMVSRMTVAAALRDLPEPPAPQPTLRATLGQAIAALATLDRAPSAALGAWGRLLRGLIVRGLVPLALGGWLLRNAIAQGDALIFSLGLSCVLAGLVLALRWLALAAVGAYVRRSAPANAWTIAARATRAADRVSAVLIGGGLALYWSLPFDALAGLGVARFAGGIQVFFVAGVMMVFGAVLALAPNLDALLAPLRWLGSRAGRLSHVTRIALVYSAQQRFRTGVGLALFSLVCFTMVVMACIAASTTENYDNLLNQAAGYDIAGQPLFTPVGDARQLQATLHRTASGAANGLSAVSVATPLPLGIVQPDAPNAAWRFYPVSEVQGGFLDGIGLPLVARTQGFASDAAVWRAVRNRPGSVVIDIGALSRGDAAALGIQPPPSVTGAQFTGPPIAAGLPGLSGLESLHGGRGTDSEQTGALAEIAGTVYDPNLLREYTLRLRGVVTGAGTIAPATLWVADLRGGPAAKLTVVGLVDNQSGQRYGLFGSPATFAPVESGLPAFGNQYYYFKVKPGVDAHAEAQSIGSALLDHGFETTVIQDVLLDVNGPRVFISRVLVGLVGLTLLVGAAALAVSGSRAVVERRQQIGMLRALGFHRLHVQGIFLLESLLIGVVGTALGIALGLVLCRNVFAVDFFAQVQTGLTLVVPWGELAAICGAALVASLVAALLPAWQAGRVAPADALRYE
jgi:putative ABC transport system permease protein